MNTSFLANSSGFRLALCVLFCLLIGMPLMGTFLKIGTTSASDIAQNEKRGQAAVPDAVGLVSNTTNYAAGVEMAFNDRFGFRGPLLHLNALLCIRWLKQSPVNWVIAGRNGWYYYGDEITYYSNTPPYDARQLEWYAKVLEDRRKALAAHGCRYILLIAPNKSSIYPEFLPANVRRSKVLRCDQLLAYLREHTHVQMVDVRPALMAAKQTAPVYFKTDTHWNEFGGLIATQQLDDAMRSWYPRVRVPGLGDFRISTANRPRDLARMMDASDVIHETYNQLNPIDLRQAHSVDDYLSNRHDTSGFTFATQIDNSSLPRLLIFRDSFTGALQPYLSEQFSRAAYVGEANFVPFEPGVSTRSIPIS